jgi:hypothetical protein
VSELARAHGWRGFDNIAARTHGGWQYDCAGMPSMMGCGNQTVIGRRWAKVGTKSTGWVVMYGTDFDGTPDEDVVLAFCPSCAEIVRARAAVSS